jgi:hypothetical protein
MLVTNVNLSTNTLTVVRGYNGTTAATHSSGAGVFFRTDQRGNAYSGTPDIGAFKFTSTAPGTPSITSVSPNSGPAAGGTSVTIAGSNLANATAVFFGGLPATIVSDSGTQIVAIAPTEPANTTVDVTVTTVGGKTSAISRPADQYTFSAASAPTVTSPTAANITSTSVTLGGTVASDGGAPILPRGVLYSAAWRALLRHQ